MNTVSHTVVGGIASTYMRSSSPASRGVALQVAI
jgi:hypothetical protein